jgi:3-deoxy-D-manno-octulosonic-acid transferase
MVGEPRWERVSERAQVGNLRARELIQYFHSAQRPWGILGSIWQEDLNQMASIFQDLPGTLWVVPHRIDLDTLHAIETFLRMHHKTPIRTQSLDLKQNPPTLNSKACILVDEIGFLSELYSVADWAYVGGGFGAGLHSTIEPAIHGIPVAGGPTKSEQFSEVQELGKTGQLQILRKSFDFAQWSQALQEQSFYGKKQTWKEESQRRMGATQKIIQAIENLR